MCKCFISLGKIQLEKLHASFDELWWNEVGSFKFPGSKVKSQAFSRTQNDIWTSFIRAYKQ